MEEPEHARLFRFMADAPTTTMQRLKGMCMPYIYAPPHALAELPARIDRGGLLSTRGDKNINVKSYKNRIC